jgi:hypothetical protein
MALLSGLESVAWADLEHAYGPATDVPRLLRALLQDEQRESAMYELWGNVFHQGTVYQASPQVIPFLLELLCDGPPDAALRQFILDYLYHLACGYPEDLFPQLIDDPETYYASRCEGVEGSNGEDQSDTAAGYARDCYRRVQAALGHIAPFALDGNDGVAKEAIALLGGFRTSASRDALRSVVERASGERLGIALVALARLDGKVARASALPRLQASDPVLALHAAVACVLADPATPPDAAISILVSPLDEELAKRESPLTETIGTLVTRCLGALEGPRAATAIDAIAAMLGTAKPMTNLSAASALLHLAFGDNEVPGVASELTPPQRRALAAIARDGMFRIDGSVWVNFSDLLRTRNLPSKRDDILRWLNG